MSQRMKRNPWQLFVADDISPISAQLVGRIGRTIGQREYEIVGAELAEPKHQAKLELLATMCAQDLDRLGRQRDAAAPMASLRRLEPQSRLGFLQAALDTHHGTV